MSARAKANNSKSGRQHTHVQPIHRAAVPPSTQGANRDKFRFTLIRGPGLDPVLVDDLVEEATWTDNHEEGGGSFSGSVTFRAPPQGHLDIQEGHRLLASWNPGNGRWYPLWVMAITQPQADMNSGSYQYTAADEVFTRLATFMDDFVYRRSKAKPRGWTGDEILRDVLKRCGIPVGNIPVLKARHMKLVQRNASAGDVVQVVLNRERLEIGTRWQIVGWGGRFNVVPLYRKNRNLLMLSQLITEATLNYGYPNNGNGATELAVKATTGSGKKKRKVAFIVRSPQAEFRFGRIKQKFAVRADSQAKARRIAKRRLATLAKPYLQITLTHAGIPTVRGGDALFVQFPDDSFGSGPNVNNKIAYVSNASHTVNASGYTMDLELRFDDLLATLDQAATRSKKKREAAALKRKRKGAAKSTPPKPKKAAQRS